MHPETAFSAKCKILAEIWIDHRDDADFEYFVQYNDLGLPLAYSLVNKMFVETQIVKELIDETFDLFLATMGVDDLGYKTFDEVVIAKEFKDA